jgi:hypothetical protein
VAVKNVPPVRVIPDRITISGSNHERSAPDGGSLYDADGPFIYMGDPEDEFQWLSEEDLRTATDEELVEQVMTLQRHVHTLQNDLDELRGLAYLLLDLEAGLVEEFHPELHALLEDLESEDHPEEEIDFDTELE